MVSFLIKIKAEEKDAELLGHMMVVVGKIAKQEKLDEGFRIVINDGKQGCTIFYSTCVKNC